MLSDLKVCRAGVWAGRAAIALLLAASALATAAVASAQQTERDRKIAFGLNIYKEKANCQFCHKWDGSGDQGYGGLALSLRKTELSRDQLYEVIQCGRPATGMPYHDKFAYTDRRCYGSTREEFGDNVPVQPVQFLAKSEMEALLDFLYARIVGKGPATYEDCVEFWGTGTRQCDTLKK